MGSVAMVDPLHEIMFDMVHCLRYISYAQSLGVLYPYLQATGFHYDKFSLFLTLILLVRVETSGEWAAQWSSSQCPSLIFKRKETTSNIIL
jgi:hypothetical protein